MTIMSTITAAIVVYFHAALGFWWHVPAEIGDETVRSLHIYKTEWEATALIAPQTP